MSELPMEAFDAAGTDVNAGVREFVERIYGRDQIVDVAGVFQVDELAALVQRREALARRLEGVLYAIHTSETEKLAMPDDDERKREPVERPTIKQPSAVLKSCESKNGYGS